MPKKNGAVLPPSAGRLHPRTRQPGAPEIPQQSILELAFDAVIETDPQGVVTRWDPRADKIFGWTASEMIGKVIFEVVVPPQYRAAHQQAFCNLLTRGDGLLVVSDRMESKTVHRDGRTQFMEVTLWASRAARPPRINLLIRDITAQKQLEK